jgi:hypothetical protein
MACRGLSGAVAYSVAATAVTVVDLIADIPPDSVYIPRNYRAKQFASCH